MGAEIKRGSGGRGERRRTRDVDLLDHEGRRLVEEDAGAGGDGDDAGAVHGLASPGLRGGVRHSSSRGNPRMEKLLKEKEDI